ncbi:MAG TPA: ribosome biogenesis GTPase Der, partial [Thermoanaerobaculia bacterium]|nr:ribosome biogenesis GTPase Der [Thermoanaerobaculia bacterium]
VGKSTLFNRISGRRRALTHDLPGMTRDRLSGVVTLDDGRRFELIDTGGLEFGDRPMSAFATEIRQQAAIAMEEADLILFVVDAVEGVAPEDLDIAQQLRSASRRVVVIVNKMDTRLGRENEYAFHALGFDRMIAISAEHGQNMDELFESFDEVITAIPEAEEDLDAPARIAIIGRPNVGKSSLLNRLMDEERAVVSEISGTTRDATDSMIERNGRQYLLIDTAGIRRKGKTTDEAEKLAVISARKAIERCELALLVVDGVEGITAQDAHVAGYAEEEGKAAMILVNKWDIVERSETLTREFEDQVRMRLKFLSYAPIEFISAKSGRRIEKLFPTIDRIIAGYRQRFKTSQLNEILEQAARQHTPPSVRGKPRRFYYATQLKAAPPTVAIFSNINEPLHFSYHRYLDNQFREALGLTGTPVHLVLRGRKGMEKEPRGGPTPAGKPKPRIPKGKLQERKAKREREVEKTKPKR